MINIEPTDIIPKPLLWLITIPCIVLFLPVGVIYFLICLAQAIYFKMPFHRYRHDIIYSMARPGFYIGMFLSLLIFQVISIPRAIAMKKEEKREKERLQTKRMLCETWLNQFDFVESMNRRVQLYISKGEAVGRVVVREVNEEQAALIESKKTSLPDRIYLEVNRVST